jgi:hypothetical protein
MSEPLARRITEGELQNAKAAGCDTPGCLGEAWIMVTGRKYCERCRPPSPPLLLYACACGFFKARGEPSCPNGHGHESHGPFKTEGDGDAVLRAIYEDGRANA